MAPLDFLKTRTAVEGTKAPSTGRFAGDRVNKENGFKEKTFNDSFVVPFSSMEFLKRELLSLEPEALYAGFEMLNTPFVLRQSSLDRVSAFDPKRSKTWHSVDDLLTYMAGKANKKDPYATLMLTKSRLEEFVGRDIDRLESAGYTIPLGRLVYEFLDETKGIFISLVQEKSKVESNFSFKTNVSADIYRKYGVRGKIVEVQQRYEKLKAKYSAK